MVEIFQSRIEVTNPGLPLIDINRFIDNPPKSRNEILSSLMRRLKMCEELGSGWDRIALECELMQLPAPKIVLYEENTKVTLFSSLPFASIPHEEKLWSCYLHACIKYLTHEGLTNSSLRQRFGLGDTASAQVSRLIKEAVSMGLIKPFLLAICFLHKYRGGVTGAEPPFERVAEDRFYGLQRGGDFPLLTSIAITLDKTQ